MANTSFNLVDLDFNTFKESLKTFLRSQSQFQDIDFDASNISVLLDLLAYNTYHNAFYLNMIGNEMFLDTALLHDSVVSHVKELNYTPRSALSSRITIDVGVTPATLVESVIIPKGKTFTARISTNTYTFSTAETIVMDGSYNSNTGLNEFSSSDVEIFEGFTTTDSFVVDTADTTQRFVLSNPNIDTTSISVRVIEDGSANTIDFLQTSSLFGVTANTPAFFVQGAENKQYEISFGNDVTGRRPKNGAVIVCEYRVCSGEAPNGINTINIDGDIDGHANVSVTIVREAELGAEQEGIESIRFNAPRFFQTQERAVTARDYKVLLQSKFPEIESINVYGGEDAVPPQYGKVMVAIDVTNADGVPQSSISRYQEYLAERTPIVIEPVFVSPEFIYVSINSDVTYDLNTSAVPANDIRALVYDAIDSFCANNINDFNVTLRYSKLVGAIDSAHSSIVSNDTSIRLIKYFVPSYDDMYEERAAPILVEFNNSISAVENVREFTLKLGGAQYTTKLRDDGAGNIVAVLSGETTTIPVGTVDYDTGTITINSMVVTGYTGEGIDFTATPTEKDVSAARNYILENRASDVRVNVRGIYA